MGQTTPNFQKTICSAPASPSSNYYRSSSITLSRNSSELLPNDFFQELQPIQLEFLQAIESILKLMQNQKNSEIVTENQSVQIQQQLQKNGFYEGKEENISLLMLQMQYDPKLLILALIYTCRILELNILKVDKINISRLFFFGFVTATKYQAPIDQILKNNEYARISKVSSELEFRNMELQFLQLLKNKLFVDQIELCVTSQKIINFIKANYKIERKCKSAGKFLKQF